MFLWLEFANGAGTPKWLMALMGRLGKKAKASRTTSSAEKKTKLIRT